MALSDSVRHLARAFALRDPAELNRRREDLLAVHSALARGRLSERSWRSLKRVLPPIHWWRSWDRCERLRRAAIGLAGPAILPRLLSGADGRTSGQFLRTKAAVLTKGPDAPTLSS